MNIRDKIVCLYPEKDFKSGVKLNRYKVYEIIYFPFFCNSVFIINDNSNCCHSQDCFVTLSDYRKMKLIKLNNKI